MRQRSSTARPKAPAPTATVTVPAPTDGTIRYYTGTYTVQNGVIVAAHIVLD